jgi:RhtB (resistance to homoserine/threonine) family protein
MSSRYLSEFFALALVHFLAVVSPGPDFAITVKQSILYGRNTAIITSIGIGIGISIHVFYTLIGLSFIVSSSPLFFEGSKILGAAYLTYLAISLLKSQRKVDSNLNSNLVQKIKTPSARSALWTGILTNATNPKATLFFLSIFTVIISRETPLPIQIGYGVWMCTVNALWFILVSLFFSHEKVRGKFLKFGHWFERGMGVILLGLAAKLAFTTIK